MRKRTLGVVLLAGLAISGSGAFTGSNTMPAGSDAVKAGYGAVTATGITVTDTEYVFNSTNDKMHQIGFVTSTDMTGLTAHVTLTASSAPTTVVAQMDCTTSTTSVLGLTLSGSTEILCDFSPDVALTTFDTIGLTVSSNSV